MATIDEVRVLIGDDEEPYTYTDAQITSLLAMVDDSPYIAGALLLERASVEAAVSVRTDDLQISGKEQSASLWARAQALRDMAAGVDDGLNDEAFQIVYREGNSYPWAEGSARPSWGF